MWPEWTLGITGVLIAILVTVLQSRKQSRSMLSMERYAELNALLLDKEAVWEQLRRDNKINAIKSYRIQTGTGLKEAKYAVEMMEQEMRRATMAELIEANRGMDGVVRRLLVGDKIGAIKIYRKETGVGLKEAKNAIDGMVIETKMTSIVARDQPGQRYVDSDELQRLIRIGKRIQAIKYYRETTGVGLKEAKDAVDALSAQMHQNI